MQSLPCEAYGPGLGQHEDSVPFSLEFQPVCCSFAIPGVNGSVNDGVDDFNDTLGGIDGSINDINDINGIDGSIDGSIDSIKSINSSFEGSESNVDQFFNPSNQSNVIADDGDLTLQCIQFYMKMTRKRGAE